MFGLILGLGALMGAAYLGFSVILFAPVFALLAASLSGLHALPTYTEIFLPSMAAYLKVYLPFFLLGAVFGKIMEHTGSAEALALWIARLLGPGRAALGVVLACAVLTYGGVSLFVVAFAVYPVGASLFRAADIPKRLLPATIALGAFTFTMDALPGTPQIQNAIPMKFFNTDLYAAPMMGILGAIIVLAVGLSYVNRQIRLAREAKEGYGVDDWTSEIEGASTDLPSPYKAIVPLLLVLGLTLILQKVVFLQWDISEWASLPPYSIKPSDHRGLMNNWALIVALVVGILSAILLNARRVRRSNALSTTLNAATAGALLAVMNTASEVGFGNVIKSLPGFSAIARFLTDPRLFENPLLSEAVAVNLLAGITGSASGGMSIALDTFGKQYLEWAHRLAVSPQLLHRVAAMASGGMDTLPHNGAVITLLAIAGLTHRKAYFGIFVITLIKTMTVFVLIGLNALIPLA
jgi:H+/gluconate symporter-like permease